MPSTVGIIYPPPEVRSIVDKTATFVARNGPEFEEKIRANEISNPKFNFLSSNDPYHAYYQHKIRELREGKTSSGAATAPTPVKPAEDATASTTTSSSTSKESASNLMQNLNISSRTLDTQAKLKEQMIILKDPPAELEFILEAPSITPLDVDTIKLTAQFVARNGKPFLTQLVNKEQRNPMFDFLKPQHSHFQYFNKLVEQYTKILMPPKDLVEKMRHELNAPFSVIKALQYRVEWERAEQREKAKENELAERERVAYAQIDWHDFVVVETVDFQAHEMGNFPPPTTPADVGARVIALERLEASGQAPTSANLDEMNSHMYVERILADESRVVELAPAVEEEKQQRVNPPNPENVIIRKDYDPKNKNPQAGGPAKVTTVEQHYKSPITGELIPASKMAEHMRISMLNPDWMKQKEKERKEREENEEVIASGYNIEANLKRMAEYRSDMFGTGSEETVIGHRKNSGMMDMEDSDSRGGGDEPSSSMWTDVAATTSEESASKYSNNGSTISSGPSKSTTMSNNSATIVVPPLPASMIPKIPSTAMTPQQMMHHHHHLQPPPPSMQMQMPLPPPPARSLMLTPSSLPPPPPGAPMPVSALPQLPGELAASYPGDEPYAKRQKTEEQLVPEAEFLAKYGSSGPVTFNVQVPLVSDKPEWSLNGQSIPLTLPLTETVATIKNKLAEMLTMPIAKQKLQLETMFIKDTNTLAFYNITPESVVHLQLKERGGRKK